MIGFKEFEEKLRNLPIELQEEADEEVAEAAREWAELAISAAPRDLGGLIRGIGSDHIAPMIAEVYSNAESSPWNEWGTGHRAIVPGELANYASQFIGKSSRGKLNAKDAIYQWAKRHGFENPWFAFKSIMENGRYPHPFFFIHKPIVEANFLGRLKKIIETPK